MSDSDVRPIVIGLGNPILTDDAIGWRVADVVRNALAPDLQVDIVQVCLGGLSLAEMLVDYHRAIIIDAIMTRDGQPGTVYHLHLTDLPGTLNSASAHDTNLTTALNALRRLGAVVPADGAIEFVAIEAQDVLTFSETCTPAVEASIPSAANTVLRLLGGDSSAS
ncbi:MAG: hydrogenase maturation protease [Chloroflexi bacterium]|nr:hydrogenase maturation protease [Chloroflexota bacterium]